MAFQHSNCISSLEINPQSTVAILFNAMMITTCFLQGFSLPTQSVERRLHESEELRVKVITQRHSLQILLPFISLDILQLKWKNAICDRQLLSYAWGWKRQEKKALRWIKMLAAMTNDVSPQVPAWGMERITSYKSYPLTYTLAHACTYTHIKSH